MSVIVRPPDDAGTLALGAIGGALAGATALAVLVGGSAFDGRAPAVAVNAVGAWAVRWLQTADPSALDNVYADATPIGILSAIIVGAAVGAPLAAWIARYPEDHPAAWGVMAGVGLWAATRWLIGPGLDPVLVRPGASVNAWILAAAHIVYGLVIGMWIHAALGDAPRTDVEAR